MKPGKGLWKACAVAMLLVGTAGEVAAQDYPSRAITVIVPFPPGGASDVVARIVTNQMSKILGQSIIIENVSGAGGTVGSGRVAAAARLYPPGRRNGLACRGARAHAEPQI
jgi:tripartite-type tricarboxylate transporter receptor subunit TctC